MRDESASANRPTTSPLLLVFAKAPVPGRVKTRLALELGDVEAAAVYRRMGRRVVDRLRTGPFRTVVYFDPPEAEEAMVEWLGSEGLEFHPQPPGGLGHRLAAGFEWGFERSDRVAAVGTDIPELGPGTVDRAFAALSNAERADVVFGPALDGGYYLVALKRPAPALFRDIPWSTPDVMATSLARAASAGLRVLRLPPLADVDHLADLPDHLR